MNRDDRLFAVIGGTVVTAVTTLFLVFASGIKVIEEEPAPVRVAPIEAASEPAPSPDVVEARLTEPEPEDVDELVRTVVSGLSGHPRLAAWLLGDDLLVRFVGAVEAVADGYSPREELDFLAPHRALYVRQEDDRYFITAASFLRYDLVAEVLSSVDAESAVAVYRELEPRIFEARADIAWHRGDFEDRLRQAVDHLLEVEVPDGPIEVERRTMTYAFADDGLERLSGAQRQLLRMGSRNARLIQQKLVEIRTAFGWPDPVTRSDVMHAVLTEESPAAPVAEHVLVAEELSSDVPEEGAAAPATASPSPETSVASADPADPLIVEPARALSEEAAVVVHESAP